MTGQHVRLLLWMVILGATAPAAWAQSLDGVIDIHAHANPDSMARSIDVLDLARLAQARGMRGLVLKNHYESTASMAYLARKAAPGLEVFGGVVLNRSVGGINAAAIDYMTGVAGGWGRVVWMPTYDSEHHVRSSGENRPFVSVSRDGALLPEVIEVIGIVAERGLMLATGHSSPAEVLLLVREARRQGVRHVVVTHPLDPPVRMTVADMREAAGLGAYLELAVGRADAVAYAEVVRELGPESLVLSSDLGQATTPLHPDGLSAFFEALARQGISPHDIEIMSQTNPATLLDLD